MDARTEEGRRSTACLRASEGRTPARTLRLRTVAAAGALLMTAACSNPVAVQEAPETVEHTTSSGNHTTSSGNHSTSSGNLSRADARGR